MRPLPAAVLILTLPAAALAGIETDVAPSRPEAGIAVPEGQPTRWLECWIDGRRQVVETDGLPGGGGPRVVVIRRDDGSVTTLTITGDRASGCLPLAR